MDEIIGELVVVDVAEMNDIKADDHKEDSQLSKGIAKAIFVELGVGSYNKLCHLSVVIGTIFIDGRLEPIPILIGFPCYVQH